MGQSIIFFIAGLLVSRWVEGLLSRAILKLPVPESVKSTVRRSAREREIDLKERGKVLKLSDVDAADQLAKPGQLFNDLESDESSQ